MFTKRRVLGGVAAAAGLILLATTASPAGAQTEAQGMPDRGVYEVHGADDVAERTAVANSGVDLLGIRDGAMTIVASPEQAKSLRSTGFRLEQVGDFDRMLAERSRGGRAAGVADFPPGDEAYHTHDEMKGALNKAAQNHSSITQLSSVGKSYQGRDLPVLKISDNAAQDENEPEVLFTCNQHAREHLTTEMCLHIVDRFTTGYATDPAIKQMVDSKEIWVIPQVNPDGSEYDISGGRYHGWRKNRQGQGTDPNRNWDYQWGCCGGSSGSPTSDTYRGTAPFSAPEVRAVANFVNSRVVGGAQQIKAHIDFHTFSELVLWPYGYTYNDTAPGLNQEEARRFQDIGRRMAQTNRYTPQQSSDLYITDGSVNDWMWGKHKIWSYTFEMYPRSGGIGGFYPPASVIPRETARNDRAVDILISEAR